MRERLRTSFLSVLVVIVVGMSLLTREQGKVVEWRYDRILRLGFSTAQAIELSERLDVDLYGIIGLIDRGCPHRMVLEILL